MTNKLLVLSTGAAIALALGWGCGDPNPPAKIMKGGVGSGVTGSGGELDVGSGGAAASSGGNSGSGGLTPGTGGEASGSGGSATGSGGAAAVGGEMNDTGNGGGPGSAGTGGSVSGSGGSTGAGGGAMASDVVDNFDDDDGRLLVVSGRQGPWHAFNDTNGGNQQPPVGAVFTPQSGGANGTPYAAHTMGSGYKFGGVGVDLNNASTMPEGMQCRPYDASAYKGLRFWAKGNGNLRVEFPQKAFVPTSRGGGCNESTTTCWNVYGSRSAQGALSLTDWKQVTIMFSSLEREDGSRTPAFDPGQLMGIAFKHEGDTFDFWIDEIELVR